VPKVLTDIVGDLFWRQLKVISKVSIFLDQHVDVESTNAFVLVLVLC
jgi:hypothetical protein